MQVLIDGTPLTHSASTFTDALEAARLETTRQGRVIVGIEVGGTAWMPGTTDAPDPDRMDGRDLKLITHDPSLLVSQTLLDVADLLKATGPQHHDAAMLIQSGKLGEGMQQLARTISAWESARTAITQSAALLGWPVETLLAIPDTKASDTVGLIQELTNSLHEVKRAVKASDWSGLADVLEFEMTELCKTWQGVLTDAARRIGG